MKRIRRSLTVLVASAATLALSAPAAFAADIVTVDHPWVPGSPDATGSWFPAQDRLCVEAINVGTDATVEFLKPNGVLVVLNDVRYQDPGPTCVGVNIGTQGATSKIRVAVDKDGLVEISPWKVVLS